MLKNYFATAFRNLKKSLAFATINLIGLSLGMTAFILIFQYVSFEFSVNNFHKDLPHLYRVLQETKEGKFWDYTPPILAPSAKQQFGEIENYCRVAEGIANGIVLYGEAAAIKSSKEEKSVYADGAFFDLFSFDVIEGNVKSLYKANSVAISKTTSKKYFNSGEAVGKTIKLNNDFGNTLYTIVAVYDDFPENSDMQYDIVFSLETLASKANLNDNDWANLEGTSSFLTTYLSLRSDVDYKLVEQKINVERKKVQPDLEEMARLQSVKDMHLGRNLGESYPTYGNLAFNYVMMGIAILILIIAWLNYINLTTAGSLKRAKEVGIRKTIGATKSQLIFQFLGESLLLNFSSFLLSLGLVNILQTIFNQLINKTLSLSILGHNEFWIGAALFIAIGSITSGGFAAFALSSFKPIQTLSGNLGKSIQGIWLRKSLVVFQFSISIALIASTLILFKQLNFMQTKNLGLDLNQLIVINGPEVGRDSTYRQRNESFKSKVGSLSFIKKLSSTGSVPSKGYNFSTEGIIKLSPQPGDEKITYDIAEIDENFLNTYAIPLVSGNNFTSEDCRKSWKERDRLILNERAASQMGFESPEQAINQKVKWQNQQYEIVGVVKDYHHQSLRESISPIVFVPSTNSHNFSIKLQTENVENQIASLKKVYEEYFPGNPFEYFFVDDNYNRQYQTEKKYSLIFTLASLLAIFIACLGLFGLTSYTIEQRTKEIAVRKILGANVSQITSLLSKEFLVLVAVSIFIATPLSWYFMDQWLQGFSYHISISLWTFIVAAVLAILIALVTVSTQAIKAGFSNPVDSLRRD